MPDKLKHVLFVCIGNSCRSQMAEGFARSYGRDVMKVESAGLASASAISALTHDVMWEKNIQLKGHHPKPISTCKEKPYDLVVNISGGSLPKWFKAPVIEWSIQDPIGESPEVYRRVRDDIENRVMQLILQMRREHGASARPRVRRHQSQ